MHGPATREQLIADLEMHGSMAAVARHYGIPRNTLVNRANNWGVKSPLKRGQTHEPIVNPLAPASLAPDAPDVTINGDTATIVADTFGNPDEFLRSHDLDPGEWVVTNARPNSWQALAPEGEIVTLNQLKVEAVRRVPADALLPARVDGWKPTKPKPSKRAPRPELVCVVSDTHAPYHDPGLHDCHLQWLAANKPDRAYDFGDLLDLPTPSRHRTTQGFEASPQESVNARYRLDAERVAASPGTKWAVAYGNHDERLNHAAQDKIGAHVARLARAGETLPVWDLGFLLRYDELGIEVHRPTGDYHSVTIEIAPGLFGRHGTKAGKHGGAVKAIERRDSSLGQGHDHKMMAQQHVRYDDTGEARSRWSISWGAMCARDLGYVEDPDVAQGFSTITVHANGRWHHEFAYYDSATRTLTWRDQVYTAA